MAVTFEHLGREQAMVILAVREDDVAALPQVRRIPNAPPPPKRGDEAAPEDIPDAKDDDIIARQLREAAMQEADPELKEKLWEEYRRYKKG